MESEFVEVNSNKFHIMYQTDGQVPVFMAHGFTDNGMCLKPLAEKMPEWIKTYMYDAKAHGLSDAPSIGYSQEDMARDLVCIIDELGIDEVGLYGHSLGANTVAKASEMISNPKFMILEDPAGLLYKNLNSEKRHKKKRKQFKNYRISTHREIYDDYHNTPRYCDLLATARKQLRPEALKIDKRGYEYIGNIINRPPETVILRPDKSKLSYADKDTKLPDNVEMRNVEDTSHTIFRDNPERCMEILKEFLESKK
jgi:pimeloyl-ACP methyl ester carboxylesterase